MGASTMLNRVSILVNIGYGEELDNDLRSSFVTLCISRSLVTHTLKYRP